MPSWIPLMVSSIRVRLVFSSWLRNESGTDSIGYLSQPRQAEIEAGRTLDEVLGIQPGYRTFDVAWINTRNGRSQLQVTLKYAENQHQFKLNMVQENSAWVIDAIIK